MHEDDIHLFTVGDDAIEWNIGDRMMIISWTISAWETFRAMAAEVGRSLDIEYINELV